ncbi:hypothetical protein D3C75_904790 [compost metagenome]
MLKACNFFVFYKEFEMPIEQHKGMMITLGFFIQRCHQSHAFCRIDLAEDRGNDLPSVVLALLIMHSNILLIHRSILLMGINHLMSQLLKFFWI